MQQHFGKLHITAFILLGSVLTSCGQQSHTESTLEGVDIHTKRAAIRPTQGDGHLGNGYGDVTVKSFPSAQGHVRVWWATTGKDRPPQADLNGNDVPDFVETVAQVGDEVIAYLNQNKWRTAISDETLNDGDNGTDARFDVYLRNMTAGDGTFIRERCVAQGCAGYITIDNDFFGSNYRSLDEAARVLVAHEYFHAVQSAYTLDVEGWVSEGTATWFEEVFYPEQRDFEHLANLYFKEHTRSLNDRVRGPVDAFSYGASLFFYYLSLTYDDALIREVVEQLKVDEPQHMAVNRALTARNTTMHDAFLGFSIYNLFTGARATSNYAYPMAAEFDQVTVATLGTHSALNWNVTQDPFSSKYAVFDTTQDITATIKSVGEDKIPHIALVSANEYSKDGGHYLLSQQATRLPASSAPFYIVSASGAEKSSAVVQIRVAKAQVNEDMGDDMSLDMSMDMPEKMANNMVETTDTSDGGCGAVDHKPNGALPFVWVFGLILFWSRKL